MPNFGSEARSQPETPEIELLECFLAPAALMAIAQRNVLQAAIQ